jgi:hypothetical protein
MADAKEPSKAQLFFMNHGEKLALGVCAAALVGYLVYSFALAGDDPTSRDLAGLTTAVEQERNNAHGDLAPGKIDSVSGDALKPYNSQFTATESNPWVGSISTDIKVKPVTKKIDKEPPTVLANVILQTKVDVALDGLTIHFAPEALDKDTKEAPIDHFIVERKGKDGKWEVLAEKVSSSATSYTDKNIDPKTEYGYRVRAVTSDTKWRKENSADGISKASAEATAKSLGIWKITILMANKNDQVDPDAKGTAYILLEKFDKVHGRVEFKRNYTEGDIIGVVDGKTVHKISISGGKSVDVDFNCGALLKSIENIKADVKFKKCVKKMTSTGSEGCDTVEEKVAMSSKKITIIDEDKAKLVIYQPELVAPDQLCEEHGGRKSGTDPGKMTEAEKKKDAEAKVAMAEADKQYETDKAKAAPMYKSLLEKFGQTPTIKDNKKKIEERAKPPK